MGEVSTDTGLNEKLDRDIARIDQRIERLSERTDARIEAMYRLMVQSAFWILLVVMVGGFAAVLVALFLTR